MCSPPGAEGVDSSGRYVSLRAVPRVSACVSRTRLSSRGGGPRRKTEMNRTSQVAQRWRLAHGDATPPQDAQGMLVYNDLWPTSVLLLRQPTDRLSRGQTQGLPPQRDRSGFHATAGTTYKHTKKSNVRLHLKLCPGTRLREVHSTETRGSGRSDASSLMSSSLSRSIEVSGARERP